MSRPIDIIESKYKPKMYRILWEDLDGKVSVSNNWYNKQRAVELLKVYESNHDENQKVS